MIALVSELIMILDVKDLWWTNFILSHLPKGPNNQLLSMSKLILIYGQKCLSLLKFSILNTRPNYPGTRVVKKVSNHPGTRVLEFGNNSNSPVSKTSMHVLAMSN